MSSAIHRTFVAAGRSRAAPGRSVAITSTPRRASSASTWRPINPLAPVTATFMKTLSLRLGREFHDLFDEPPPHPVRHSAGLDVSCFTDQLRDGELIRLMIDRKKLV